MVVNWFDPVVRYQKSPCSPQAEPLFDSDLSGPDRSDAGPTVQSQEVLRDSSFHHRRLILAYLLELGNYNS